MPFETTQLRYCFIWLLSPIWEVLFVCLFWSLLDSSFKCPTLGQGSSASFKACGAFPMQHLVWPGLRTWGLKILRKQVIYSGTCRAILGGFLLSLQSVLSLEVYRRNAPGRQAGAESITLSLWTCLLLGNVFNSPTRRASFLPTLSQCTLGWVGGFCLFSWLPEISLTYRSRTCNRINTIVILVQTVMVSVLVALYIALVLLKTLTFLTSLVLLETSFAFSCFFFHCAE